ncbi:MAG: glycosyltransferase family 2 protein [Nitrospirae bacterium]|nr:glycosyltransferase family 2 protein [Nitrospirota bacterium]
MNDKGIDISIVYLTKNGGELFKDSLGSVFEQKIDKKFEVICIDSGSTDSTLDVIRKYPIGLYQLKPEDFSFGPARDFGFSKAGGEIIVTLSQDVIPCNEKWLYYLTEPFVSPDISVVQGQDVVPAKKDIFFWEKAGHFYFTREIRKWVREYGIGLGCTNMAIRRNVWMECKFGNTPMSEDKSLQIILHKKGYKIVYVEEAQAYHGHSYNMNSLIKRCENEGLGWRYVDVGYSFVDMIIDILSLRKFIILLVGTFTRKITSLSAFLYPVIRPIWLFKGNHFTKKYRY